MRSRLHPLHGWHSSFAECTRPSTRRQMASPLRGNTPKGRTNDLPTPHRGTGRWHLCHSPTRKFEKDANSGPSCSDRQRDRQAEGAVVIHKSGTSASEEINRRDQSPPTRCIVGTESRRTNIAQYKQVQIIRFRPSGAECFLQAIMLIPILMFY